MKIITGVELMAGSNEERLPDFDEDFPCITTCAAFSRTTHPATPWHWHKAFELVYIHSGTLIYDTPGGRIELAQGCGALINSNVLHATSLPDHSASCVQYLHLFDPVFLSGASGSRIDRKYIRPIAASRNMALIHLFPGRSDHAAILRELLESFGLHPDMPGYEILIRGQLSKIWFQLFDLVQDQIRPESRDDLSVRIKMMMGYIHEHYAEAISVGQLAQAAICSQRECYRAFHKCLHMTPVEYLQSYRLQMACRMLAENKESLTTIAHSCGFGSSSYLGKVFRCEFGMTPMQYRNARQHC